MARRRRLPVPTVDLRAELRRHYVLLEYRWMLRDDGDSPFRSPWRQRIDTLWAGRTLEVYGWEVAGWVPVDPQRRYRLLGDGTLEPISVGSSGSFGDRPQAARQ